MMVITCTVIPALLIIHDGLAYLPRVVSKVIALRTSHNAFKTAAEENARVTKFIEVYRATEVLVTTFNALSCDVGPVAQFAWMAITTMGLVVILRSNCWHERILACFLIVVNVCTGVIYCHVSGSIHEKSKEILLGLRRKCHVKYNQLRLKALQPIKIYCGPLFYFDKSIFISAVGAIQDTTITIVLA
ncbi:unnamed protein product [Allacma fusca]|uniref:Uncharacterized protein n=1 Tax=Allacma fusca TaxID=39272 RepID=A0A8J2JXM4_9HEXA|nr:unnamed protein product [Allacma fusca]